MTIQKEVLLNRALDVIKKANEKNIVLRLIGGAAIAYLSPNGSQLFPRNYKDADYFGLSSQRKEISSLLESLGMEANKRFNALHGYNRLMFYDPVLDSTIDIFLDEFMMCHKLVLKDRLKLYYPTIPPSDLLLTKMQIINLTENDKKDVAALLYDFEIGDKDTEKTIDGNYIANILSQDWGFYKTYTINHERIIEFLKDNKYANQIVPKLNKLLEKIEKHPKTMKWKMRAKIGEKVKWYEEPEEVNTNFKETS
ncbi:hypothetical protein DFR86_05405 [Acidianus sulfidivorans JP7]|uniref:Nucleotidyltransferase n=1 Tax=Acidianus sulfidivorans JP7 TaxID=619593 RepID=A0A2U9IM18_9CREN|nr:hypothetical protein [Acidianus sulfidivorans]AWR97053.1 hypothetical protein DFR86_05405 [Acidianus sulfidivorans JP7]